MMLEFSNLWASNSTNMGISLRSYRTLKPRSSIGPISAFIAGRVLLVRLKLLSLHWAHVSHPYSFLGSLCRGLTCLYCAMVPFAEFTGSWVGPVNAMRRLQMENTLRAIVNLPSSLGKDTLVVLLSASFVGSFVTVSAGLGGGILLLSVLASFLPGHALIPVHGAIQLGSNTGRLLILIRDANWQHLATFGIGSVVGTLIGGRISVGIDPALVQVGIGLFVLWSVAYSPPQWLAAVPVLTGLVSSFLTMLFGATGPFVAVFVKSLDLPRHTWVATMATFMGVQHFLKVFVFITLGFSFASWLPFIILMVLAGFAGTVSGRYLVLDQTDDHRFRNLLNFVLVLIALRLIFVGSSGLVGSFRGIRLTSF